MQRIIIRSLLLERGDQRLVWVDRYYRLKLLFGASPDTPNIRFTFANNFKDAIVLSKLYSAAVKTISSIQAALEELELAAKVPASIHLKARLLQMQVDLLHNMSMDERMGGRVQEARSAEERCRALCELGLSQYQSYTWSKSVTYLLNGALGVFDYFADNTTSSRIYLKRAIAEYSEASTPFEKNDTHMVGAAHLYMGDIEREAGNLKEAVRHYHTASDLLDSVSKVEVLGRLAVIELQTGNRAGVAKRLAEKALRLSAHLDRRIDLDEELKLYLAEAEYQLGNIDKTIRIYQEIVSKTVDEERRAKLADWLQTAMSKNVQKARNENGG